MPSSASSEALGVVVELVGDVLTVAGLTGQRLAALRAEQRALDEAAAALAADADANADATPPVSGRRGPCLSTLWVGSFLVYAVGQALELVALGYASEPTVVATGTLTLVFNAFASTWVFGEAFAWRPPPTTDITRSTSRVWGELAQTAGEAAETEQRKRSVSSRIRAAMVWLRDWDGFNLALLVVGSVLTVVFSPLPSQDEEEKLDAHQLVRMWFETPFVYFSFLASTALVFFVIQMCRAPPPTFSSPPAPSPAPLPPTTLPSSSTTTTTLTSFEAARQASSTTNGSGSLPAGALQHHSRHVVADADTVAPRPFRLAFVLAVMASFSVTMSKVVTELFFRRREGAEKQFSGMGSVVMLTLWLASLVAQLVVLNVGLRDFEQSTFVPLAETMGAAFTILAGILYFKTYRDFSGPGSVAGFVLGVLMLTVGVFFTSRRHAPTKAEMQERFHQQGSPRLASLTLPSLQELRRSVSSGSRWVGLGVSAPLLDGVDAGTSNQPLLGGESAGAGAPSSSSRSSSSSLEVDDVP